MKFKHPGAVNNKSDLEFVRARIEANQKPWASKFVEMLKFATPYTKDTAPLDGFENDQKEDALKAYSNSLAWYYTRNEMFAKNAIQVLNTWAKTFTGYKMPPTCSGNQSQLNASWIGALLGPAAEIMRGYEGWDSSEITLTKRMFREKFYPILKQMSNYNGNNDLTQIDALMNIAIFCEDEKEFKLGIHRLRARNKAYFYLKSDSANIRNYGGSNDNKWYSPILWIDGLTQETCRDIGHHAQFGLASAIHAAEVAWNQGIDFYEEDKMRFVAALEFTSQELLKGEGRFISVCSSDKTGHDKTRDDDFFDTFQMGYNHYHNRMKMELPFTKALLETKIRLGARSDWNIFHETLTHFIPDAKEMLEIIKVEGFTR